MVVNKFPLMVSHADFALVQDFLRQHIPVNPPLHHQVSLPRPVPVSVPVSLPQHPQVVLPLKVRVILLLIRRQQVLV